MLAGFPGFDHHAVSFPTGPSVSGVEHTVSRQCSLAVRMALRNFVPQPPGLGSLWHVSRHYLKMTQLAFSNAASLCISPNLPKDFNRGFVEYDPTTIFHCRANNRIADNNIVYAFAMVEGHYYIRRWTCDICAKGFSQKPALQTHIDSVHKLGLPLYWMISLKNLSDDNSAVLFNL
ncbi:unnamed protein product [Dibothriocephalus latus]|uniref:C2H2-type domain-containing protein n=1 Tax=Dibothriocephalus latus TaxID=60516 RepID=A0A3P7LM62_DIBLA|nr:unnamed protein product [Dibothriocephalus latus]